MEKHVRKRRTRLSRKLSRFRLFRVLNQDRSFAIVFVVLVAVGTLLAVGTLRWWTSVPSTYRGPAVRVSGFDWLQAWSLRRSAERLAREGRHEEALYSWRAAVARNLGDAELHRGILRHLLSMPVPVPVNRIIAETSGQWLGRLTGTNALDLTLRASVLERHGVPQSGAALLAPFATRADATDELQRVLARCWLATGNLSAFERLWQQRGAEWESDPLQSFYGVAWQACTDDGRRGVEALEKLRTAAGSESLTGVVAARLLLLAGEQRLRSEDMILAIERLVLVHADTTQDHLRVWKQLAAAGRVDEARQRARDYHGTPIDAVEAARYVTQLLDLRLGREALDFLDAKIRGYGAAVEIWQAYFDALIHEERWSEFRRACAMARLLSTRQESIQGELTHAELRAALGAGRPTEAARAANEVALSTFASAARLLAAAETLRLGRFSDAAATLLRRFQTEHAEQPAFWLESFRVALNRLDLEGVRHAVGELTRLRPEDPSVAMARAGLLLITGEDDAEALRLTMTAFQRLPDHPAVRLNHAFALVRNRRADDAALVLADLSTNRLPADLAVQYDLARAEIAQAQGRLPESRAAAERVSEIGLFPTQRDRLARLRGRATATDPQP